MRKAKEGAGREGFPMTLGEPGGPDVAHGVTVKLSTSDGLVVAAAFLAVVDTIVVTNRQPTAPPEASGMTAVAVQAGVASP